MKISTIKFNYLRNEAHYQFLLLVKKLFETYPAVANIPSTAQLTSFYTLLALEGKLVDAVRASEFTKQLAETDERLDRALVGLNAAVNAALHHPDPAFVKAAEQLKIRLNAFRGEIEKKAYEEESAAVKILVADLKDRYKSQVNTLELGVWVTEIAAAQTLFEQIFLQRSAAYAALPQEKLVDVKKDIEAAYRQIMERIDAYTLLRGDAETGEFISRINDEIAYFNEHAHHRTKTDIDAAVVASIPDQPYEDKPVIVMPEATFNGHDLIFTVDYELSYRDNAAPGTASVTLHGKGAFKGKKTVSFNIIRND
jgi:hypothetical protein